MYTLHLNRMVFEAKHGVYPSEKLNPAPFLVDASIGLILSDNVQRLADTVDYAGLYRLIKDRMDQPTPLLETLVHDLAELLLQSDTRITSVDIKVTKSNPPIPGYQGSVSVSIQKNR